MARVVLENLHKSFQGPKGETVVAVREANLVIEDREFLVLVGPSGCGKSTTLRMIAGLEEITSGTIAIDGRVVNDVPPKDRDLAMVFQNYALYPHMTVYENMAFGLKLRKFPRPEIEQRVGEAADILGLGPYLDRLPKALSGGQRQRVAVGRAIVRKPKAFLFDEPLSNLDAQMRVQMRMELAKLHRRLNATMIYVTHDQVEAMTMGDRIVVMKDGVIRQVADPLTLYRRPASRFVAGFIGSPPMNFLRGVLKAHGGALCFCEATPANSHGWRLPVGAHEATLAARAGQAVVLGIRPEDVLVPAGDPATAAEGETIATVEVVEAMGAETYLHCTTGVQAFVARVAPERRFAIGQRLRVTLPSARSHYFDPATENALSQPAS